MQTSATGRRLIEDFEGFSPTAYKDQRGIWTIGYGHTQGVVEGMVCTLVQADAYLEADLATAEGAVNKVPAPLNCNQFDALVSLCFNIGSGNFAGSTLLKLLNASDFANAALEFDKWDKSGGQVVAGLLRRRIAETQEFQS